MALLKLKVKKAGLKNPKTKKMGFIARVVTNGTADFEDIAKEAGRNTTMHKAEVKLALELCMDAVAEMLKQGYIVDLGPVGKLYPSCNSTWVESIEELSLADVKPSLYYHASDEVQAAVNSAKLGWIKGSDEEDAEETLAPGTVSPTPSQGGEDNNGGTTPDPGTGGSGGQN
jgi:predicted histone-like DNA-binding protein